MTSDLSFASGELGTATPGPAKVERSSRKRGTSHPILRVVGRRLMVSLPLFFVVTILSFVLVSLAPGDPAAEILGPDATPEAYQSLREELGLTRPLYDQYWTWLTHAVRGDLGNSIFTGQSVSVDIQARYPATLSLILCAVVVSLVLGVAFGMYSAVRGGVIGRALDGLCLVAFAVPSFWIGAVLIGIFAVQLGWFPATGFVSIAESRIDWLRSLALPVTALAMHATAAIAKQTREAMLDILDSEYYRMVRANGVSPMSVVFRHGLKNAGIRVVTILGLQTIGLLGGTVLVESVFALPGLGSMAVLASQRKDLPVIQGVVALFTVIVIVINLLVDLAYTVLNPKVAAR